MDIKEAFELLLNTPELCAKAGISEGNKRQMKFKLAHQEPIRDETMSGWLHRAGFIEERTWTPPKIKTPKVETSGGK